MLPFPIGKTDTHKADVFIPPEAQMRHTATFGKSGTGKSTLMRNMMVWDVHNGVGLTALDPHADLISDVLDNIPKRRAGDVIYLNLLDPDRAIGINPLQRVSEAQKPLVVSRIIKMLQAIWSAFWGPQTEFIVPAR
jgi:DNA helicase HerA-like ATPase